MLSRVCIIVASVVSCSALELKPSVKPSVTALRLRGGMLSPDTYVKATVGVFGLYGAQMLLVPDKMVTDHFDEAPTEMTKFWIRGQSATIFSLCYALTQLPTKIAVKVCTAFSVGIGLLYPWNAKFGYLQKMPVKYPMHYVPEVLMAALSISGLLAMKKTE